MIQNREGLTNLYIGMAGTTHIVVFDKDYLKTYYIPVYGLNDESLVKELLQLEYHDASAVCDNDVALNFIITAIKEVACVTA
jgi:hypothetical protein